MELLKLLSGSEIVAQIISFLILLMIMRAFAWKPILKLLDDRSNKIGNDFKEIEASKAQAEKIRLEFEEKMRSINEISRQRIQEGVVEGQKAQEEIKHRAHIEAQRIIENANLTVKYEVAKAKEALRNDIVDLVMRSTEQLIGERMTSEDDRKLVEEFIDDFGKMNGGRGA